MLATLFCAGELSPVHASVFCAQPDFDTFSGDFRSTTMPGAILALGGVQGLGR